MTTYYITSREYVGPNQDQHLNSHTYEIATIAPRTNMSHEIKTSGWLGTTNDWAEYAHGEFETLEAATAALDAITGDDYRDSENTDPVGIDENDDPIYALVRRIAGKLESWNAESSQSWCYEAMRGDVTATTTDDEIEDMVKECESAANGEGFTLDIDAAERMYRERRDELAAERDEQDDE